MITLVPQHKKYHKSVDEPGAIRQFTSMHYKHGEMRILMLQQIEDSGTWGAECSREPATSAAAASEIAAEVPLNLQSP